MHVQLLLSLVQFLEKTLKVLVLDDLRHASFLFFDMFEVSHVW